MRRKEIVGIMRKGMAMAALAALTLALWTRPGLTQSADEIKALRKEVEAIKQGQAGIQKDLEEIKTLLRARPQAAAAPAPAPGPPQEAIVSFEGAEIKGQKTAKVVLVDFTDYQ
jgi:hypothetical protein